MNEETKEISIDEMDNQITDLLEGIKMEKRGAIWTLIFDGRKHSQQQLLESLLEEVKKLETKEYLAGSPEYHRQKALNKVKALIQSKKELL